MSDQRTASDVLNEDFLTIRHRLLDIAASLDRIDRATGADQTRADPRLTHIRSALAVLSEPDHDPTRAERVQMIFSRSYKPNWRE